MDTRKIILFDGICQLCDGFVQFVFDRDTKKQFLFAPLQSKVGRSLTDKYSLPSDLKTVVLIDEFEEKSFTHSTAVLRVCSDLNFPWTYFYYFIIIPGFIRDFAYSIVAANRYRLFGKKEGGCAYRPGLKRRFLDMYDPTLDDSSADSDKTVKNV